MSKNKRKHSWWFLMFALVAVVGCAKPATPTDADVVKAVIQRAISENCNVLTPSIRVVEKGKRQDDGSLPYRVRYTCMGSAKPAAGGQQGDRETLLNLYSTKDSDGKTVWLVR